MFPVIQVERDIISKSSSLGVPAEISGSMFPRKMQLNFPNEPGK